MWVKVGIGKSLCLCQVQPRLVPRCAKLCKSGHSCFLQKWWFLPRSSASQDKAQYWAGQGRALSTGPSPGRHCMQFGVILEPFWIHFGIILESVWSQCGATSTGPVLGQYWPSTGQGGALSTGPVLGQYWASTGCSKLAPHWLQIGSKLAPKCFQNESSASQEKDQY